MHIMFGPRASLPVTRRKLAILTLLMLLLASSEMPLAQATAKQGQALAGVWGTEQSFGPLVRGILTIDGRQPARCADEQPRGRFAGGDGSDELRLLTFQRRRPQRDALDEAMRVVLWRQAAPRS